MIPIIYQSIVYKAFELHLIGMFIKTDRSNE